MAGAGRGRVVWAVLAVALAAGRLPATDEPVRQDEENKDAEGWQKLTTQDLALQDVQALLTPGLFHPDFQTYVTFPADAKLVDLKLPHEGLGKDGKPLPPLLGAFRQNFIWLDLNGDGKADPQELAAVAADGEAGPFTFQASYDDGTAGPYVFKLKAAGDLKAATDPKTAGDPKAAGDARKFRILRCAAKQAKFMRSTLLLLDDNGNGRFNDLGRDALLVDQQPVTLLGRQVYVAGKRYELVVHPAGQTLEIRPAPPGPTGTLSMFKNHVNPQKAENLRIHTVIVSGRDNSFSFDPAHPLLEVPPGAYDLFFGFFERATERMWMRNGERTSFNVEAGKETAPAWGGPIKAEIQVESDGQSLTISKPTIYGVLSEVYTPADYRKTQCRAWMNAVYKDPHFNSERFEQLQNKRYEVLPSGDLKPLTFDYNRNEELVLGAEYMSGIVGKVRAEQRYHFEFHRKKPETKAPGL